MSKVVILSGSPSKVSRLNGIVDVTERALFQSGTVVNRVHIADLPATDLVLAKFDSAEITSVNRLVEESDGVIIASPVYKASFTGSSKLILIFFRRRG